MNKYPMKALKGIFKICTTIVINSKNDSTQCVKNKKIRL
jgi:hypothetical protein